MEEAAAFIATAGEAAVVVNVADTDDDEDGEDSEGAAGGHRARAGLTGRGEAAFSACARERVFGVAARFFRFAMLVGSGTPEGHVDATWLVVKHHHLVRAHGLSRLLNS